MTALMTPVLPLSQRERMAQILSAAAHGLARPENCGDCLEKRRQCEACKRSAADVTVLNRAAGAVRDALTAAGAMAAYAGCVLGLAGLEDGTSATAAGGAL